MLIRDKENIENDRIKILYVDDDVHNLELFRLMFKRNCVTKIAESGKKGLDILQNNDDIDVVISDLEMPDMNGLEFVRKAKEIKNDIPFFILSCSLKTDEIREAIKSNLINNFLRKPIRTNEILKEISKYYQYV